MITRASVNTKSASGAGEVFAGSDFKVFASIVASGGVVRALRAPKAAGQPRSFFDKLNAWAQGEGKPGLGYIVLEGGAGKGPIAKFVTGDRLAKLKALTGAEDGDAVFFVAERYRLPLFPLGEAAYPLVRLQLRRIFAYRGRRLRELLA